MGYTIPVLFLNYNRPNLTRQSFAVIQKLQPRQLFIACDGYRQDIPGDKEKTEEVRAIVQQVNWECEVHYNFSNTNKGCKYGVSSAITWFFEHVEAGVILEDDIIPSPGFFEFAKAMLREYKMEDRVMHISGNSFLNLLPPPNNTSFYFSSIPHVWGWATWRRAWNKYSTDMSSYDKSEDFPHIRSEELKIYYRRCFDKCKTNEIDTWDYQWGYTLWKHEGLSITPKVNLIKNIGFGQDATHTKSGSDRLKNITAGALAKPYTAPRKLEIDQDMDERLLAVHFLEGAAKNRLTNRVSRKLKSFFR